MANIIISQYYNYNPYRIKFFLHSGINEPIILNEAQRSAVIKSISVITENNDVEIKDNQILIPMTTDNKKCIEIVKDTILNTLSLLQ